MGHSPQCLGSGLIRCTKAVYWETGSVLKTKTSRGAWHIPVLPWSVPLRWQSPKPVGADSDHMGECLLLWSLCGDGNQWRGLSRTWTMSYSLPENLRHISHIPYTTPPVSSITSTAGNGSFPHPAHLDLNFWFLCFKSTTLPKIHLFLWTKKYINQTNFPRSEFGSVDWFLVRN